jgi:hypothetical protein
VTLFTYICFFFPMPPWFDAFLVWRLPGVMAAFYVVLPGVMSTLFDAGLVWLPSEMAALDVMPAWCDANQM